jgi:hypothetical protein
VNPSPSPRTRAACLDVVRRDPAAAARRLELYLGAPLAGMAVGAMVRWIAPRRRPPRLVRPRVGRIARARTRRQARGRPAKANAPPDGDDPPDDLGAPLEGERPAAVAP